MHGGLDTLSTVQKECMGIRYPEYSSEGMHGGLGTCRNYQKVRHLMWSIMGNPRVEGNVCKSTILLFWIGFLGNTPRIVISLWFCITHLQDNCVKLTIYIHQPVSIHLVLLDVLHLDNGHIVPTLLPEIGNKQNIYCINFRYFLLQVNQWKRPLFANCFTNQTLCLITYFAPCVTFGYNKQRLYNLQDKVFINVTPLFNVYRFKQKRS